MSGFTFPNITYDSILPFMVVLQKVSQDPSILDSSSCPYTPEVITFLRSLSPETSIMSAETLFGEEDSDVEVIEAEIKNQISYLSEMKLTMGGKTQKEKMDFLKISTTMLEKLVALQEKSSNMQQINEFRSEIMSIFEQILSPDQRTLVMERLETYL